MMTTPYLVDETGTKRLQVMETSVALNDTVISLRRTDATH
jgi:hypothetical protein